MIFRPEQASIYSGGIQINALSAVPWWLAGGAIDSSNVKEHVEFPTLGQLYAGGAIAATNPWSIAVKGIGYTNATNAYVFDSLTGRIVLGNNNTISYGFFYGSWANVGMFPDATTEYVWFLVSSGSSIQGYRNNTAIGAAQSSTNGIANSGSTRWRSAHDQASPWNKDVPRAAVYNIALSTDQRTALYNAMIS